ncbi:MAG: FecR domain-containing protein, partial [Rhodospirillales bacterium]
MRFSFIIAAFALALSPVAALAEDPVGVVTRLEGDATASKNGLVRSLDPGSEVFLSEVLSTGPETRLELVLTDDTRIILSDRTIASVADFSFIPAESRGNAVISLLRGAFRAISGRIADMQDKELVFRTQAATIGIRGTDFFGGYEGRKLGVALLDKDSALTVEN